MPEMLVVVVAAAVSFIGLALAASFLYWGLKTREESAARELARRLGTLADKPDDRLFRLQVRDQASETLGALGEQLDALIRQAGEEISVSDLLVRIGVTSLLAAIVLVFALGNAVGLIGLSAGLVPLLVIMSKGSERARKLSEQLPDALDLIGRSLQAGHGFSDALRMCAEEMPLPISAEFGRVYEEHRLGRDFRECLNSLVMRNPSNFDLKIFVSAVLLQRDTGGNLIEILDNIAKTVRDRFLLAAKVKALTAEARISAIILGIIPLFVTCALLVIRREYLLPLVTDPAGMTILGIAIGLFVSGVLVMFQLSRVEI